MASPENDFEPVVFWRYPELADLKERIIATSPLFAVLSGSGGAFFAPYSSEAARDAAGVKLADVAGADLFPVVAPH